MEEEEKSGHNTEPSVAVLNLIDDEVIRSRIRRLINEPKPGSLWTRLFKHPLLSLILGFLLTGLVGTWLTNNYSANQKELERERSLADELNKIRAAKLAEIWEKVYQNEAAFKHALEVSRILTFQNIFTSPPPMLPFSQLSEEEINRIKREKGARKYANLEEQSRKLWEDYDREQKEVFEPLEKATESSRQARADLETLLNKHRFWLGEEIYSQIKDYVEITEQYLRAQTDKDRKNDRIRSGEFAGMTDEELNRTLQELKARRDSLYVKFQQIRNTLLGDGRNL
jgi:hypothetical protein